MSARLRFPIAVEVTAAVEEEDQRGQKAAGLGDDALSADPWSAKVFEVPAVVSRKKLEKMPLSIEVKGTLEKVRRRVLATTSVSDGPRGTSSTAKSPTSRLRLTLPGSPAVIPVCKASSVSVRSNSKRDDAHSDLRDVDLRSSRLAKGEGRRAKVTYGERKGKLEESDRVACRERRSVRRFLGEEKSHLVDRDGVDDLEILSGGLEAELKSALAEWT